MFPCPCSPSIVWSTWPSGPTAAWNGPAPSAARYLIRYPDTHLVLAAGAAGPIHVLGPAIGTTRRGGRL
jgi:hypothetical protein